MINPVYPAHEFRIRTEDGTRKIFDENRKIWVKLTPEEWVRQNFFQWMVQVKGYPPSLIAIEKEIRLFELTKRFDMLVYDRSHQPWMMVECKAQGVPLNEKTFLQALRYNIAVPVPYIVVTNGAYCRAVLRGNEKVSELSELPEYPGL